MTDEENLDSEAELTAESPFDAIIAETRNHTNPNHKFAISHFQWKALLPYLQDNDAETLQSNAGWLSYSEAVQVILNAIEKFKPQSDWEKFEQAIELKHSKIDLVNHDNPYSGSMSYDGFRVKDNGFQFMCDLKGQVF